MINDEKMTYDMLRHKYILNKDFVEQSLNVNLLNYLNTEATMSNDMDVKIFLIRMSNLLYTFIYAYAENPDDYEYYLAKNDSLRDKLCEVLLELTYDILTNNKERGVFYEDTDSDLDIIPNQVKQMLYANKLISRSRLIGLPNNYISKRGVDY